MRTQRYYEKLEEFEREYDFIKEHRQDLENSTTERAIFYSLRVCVESSMDIVAMITKDLGITVEDDYTNIKRLEEKNHLTEKEANHLRNFNGLRNAIVHKYNNIKKNKIKKGINQMKELYNVITRLIKQYEEKEPKDKQQSK